MKNTDILFDRVLDMWFDFPLHVSSTCSNGIKKFKIVDEDKYDLVPKKSYLEGEITRKEEELKRIEEIHKITLKQKQDEIDSLKRKLTNK